VFVYPEDEDLILGTRALIEQTRESIRLSTKLLERCKAALAMIVEDSLVRTTCVRNDLASPSWSRFPRQAERFQRGRVSNYPLPETAARPIPRTGVQYGTAGVPRKAHGGAHQINSLHQCSNCGFMAAVTHPDALPAGVEASGGRSSWHLLYRLRGQT
jgi:hypothetical protein